MTKNIATPRNAWRQEVALVVQSVDDKLSSALQLDLYAGNGEMARCLMLKARNYLSEGAGLLEDASADADDYYMAAIFPAQALVLGAASMKETPVSLALLLDPAARELERASKILDTAPLTHGGKPKTGNDITQPASEQTTSDTEEGVRQRRFAGEVEQRLKIACAAAIEIDELAAMILETLEPSDGPYRAQQTLLRRLRKLGCIVLSAAGDDFESADSIRERLEA